MPSQEEFKSKRPSLQEAAESYVANRLTLYHLPASREEFRLLMEISFMEGSQWQQQQAIETLKAKLDEAKGELRELEGTHAG